MDCKEQMSQCFLTAGAVKRKVNFSCHATFCFGTRWHLRAGTKTSNPAHNCVRKGRWENPSLWSMHFCTWYCKDIFSSCNYIQQCFLTCVVLPLPQQIASNSKWGVSTHLTSHQIWEAPKISWLGYCGLEGWLTGWHTQGFWGVLSVLQSS